MFSIIDTTLVGDVPDSYVITPKQNIPDYAN